MTTRFQMEITGLLGDFWERHAKEEVEKAVRKATEDAIVEEDGAIRWKSNDRYLMDDLCEMLEYAGFVFSRKATEIKRDAQNDEFLASYRRNHRTTEEEKREMRAAFGEGQVIVNVITGERIYL